jgi:hypothetical protein
MALPLFGSCRADDPTYDPYFARIRDRVVVLVDGRPVPGVIAYDCREGWVRAVRYKNARRGAAVRDVHLGVGTERLLYGRVTVLWR